MRKSILTSLLVLAFALTAKAASGSGSGASQDFLIKMRSDIHNASVQALSKLPPGSQVEDLNFGGWIRVRTPANNGVSLSLLAMDPQIQSVQPNYKLKMLENPVLENLRNQMKKPTQGAPLAAARMQGPDNLPMPASISVQIPGADPLFSRQWGMNDIGVADAWSRSRGSPEMIVAVIDTGVDYTHEDLVPNLWRNAGEIGLDAQGRNKSSNGVDDDSNGYVDDVIGWDFVTNDNLPYDWSVVPEDLVREGGNPGHGTHCAGNVAARGDNSKGVAGVAPNVKIMSLRFLSEKGSGTTADAIKAVRYAVDNGAKVLSNSWGSEGEDPDDAAGNQALRDVITYSESKGALFIAAAGNGRNGRGYNNDTDSKPSYPASYTHESIISVAAIARNDRLGPFSNFGRTSVDLAAPGVNVFSTTVLNRYSNVVLNYFGQEITWDGTSMATPHVAGAAALYWSANPNKTWQEVKAAILGSARPVTALSGRMVTGGKLDVRALLAR